MYVLLAYGTLQCRLLIGVTALVMQEDAEMNRMKNRSVLTIMA